MKNKEYWHKRFIELENQNTKKTAKYYENLDKQFKNANKKIEADILVWYRRFAINNNISLILFSTFFELVLSGRFAWTVFLQKTKSLPEHRFIQTMKNIFPI